MSNLPDPSPFIVGTVVFVVMGIVFHALQEDKPAMLGSIRRYLAASPTPKDRKRHTNIALGLIATAVFALGPLGYTMIESHPCGAWCWWALSLLVGAYSFWELTPISRLARLSAVIVGVTIFALLARRSIYAETELDFPFLHPGVFLVEGSGNWLLLVTGQNTHRSLFNVDMMLEDRALSRAAANEPDFNKRVAMINRMMLRKNYLEIGPTFSGDRIMFTPIDVNNQEYNVRFTYRIGDKQFFAEEKIKMVNVGEKFVSASQNPLPKTEWQDSVTIKNQDGKILMHCVDPRFPRDASWIAGPVCYPGAKFAPLPRSLFARCFSRGFEFYPEN